MYRPTPHFIAALAAAVIVFLCAGAAFAADATVSWVNATQNTDGSAIPATGDNALRDTRIKYGTCNSAKTAVATQEGSLVIVPIANPTSRLITGLADREYCFQARHSNIGGQFSDFSGAVSKDFTPPLRKPRPPGSISVATLYEDMQEAARWQAYVNAPLVLFRG